MKKLYNSLLASLLLLFACFNNLQAQGPTCALATAFCTATGTSFPGPVGPGNAQLGPNYGCLLSQPCPAWYALQIATPGNITINFASVLPARDIDFAMWGPFDGVRTLEDICASNMDGLAPIACDFSIASTATVTLTGVIPGKIYIVLITNFSRLPTTINVSASGTASTDCSLRNSNALDFDGIDDVVNIANAANISNQSFVTEFWARKDVLNKNDIIFSQGTSTATNNLFQMGFKATNEFFVSFGNNDLLVPASFTDTQWHHWACIYNIATGSRRILRDGLLVASDISPSPYLGSGQMMLGENVVAPTGVLFNGRIDEFRIWNITRNDCEIGDAKNARLKGDEIGLVQYYDFDQGEGDGINTGITTLINRCIATGTAFDGLLNNFGLSGIVSNWVKNGINSTLLLDTTKPEITPCPANMTVDITPNCSAIVTNIPAVVATDNCAVSTLTWRKTGATVASSPTTGINSVNNTSFNLGVTTVTYTARDAAGNRTDCIFTVTLTESIAPTITCPANLSLGSPAAGCGVNVPNINAVFADNCGVTRLTWTKTGATVASSAATGINQASNTNFNGGTTTLTYTARDLSGNATSCSFTVTVNDVILPTITCPTNRTQNVAAGTCAETVPNINATFSDNCAVTLLTWTKTGATVENSPATGINQASGTNFNLGVTTVTYTAADATGNSRTCSFTVTITDNINPTVTCPANKTQNVDTGTCNAVVGGIDAVPADNCAVTGLTWAKTGATVENSPATGINQASGTNFNLGVTTVTYTARDAAGNTQTCNFTVTVTDNINPTITCPANVNAVAIACVTNVPAINAVFADNCAVTTLTWAKTGATVANSAPTGINQASNTGFNVGITTLTYTASDAAGNSATCNFTVTVIENVPPTLTCPANVVGNTELNICAAAIGGINAVFADNCAVTELTWTKTGATTANSPLTGINQATNTSFNLGVTTVTYTAKDFAGNATSCSFTVTVLDVRKPTVTCPTNKIVFTRNNACDTLVNNINAIFTDNCSVDTLRWTKTGATVGNSPTSGINQASGTNFNLGVTNVRYIAKDRAGNADTCNFTVTVRDNVSPILTCPTNKTQNAATGTCAALVPNIDAIFADNCNVDTLIWTKTGATLANSPTFGINQASNTNFNVGVTTVTYTAKDKAGNSATCNFTVTITDNQNPTLTCPANKTQNIDAGTCAALVPTIDAIFADNCSVDTLIWTKTGATVATSPTFGINQASNTNFNLGVTTVTYTAKDKAGNSVTCNFTVTITDNEAPDLTCPSNKTQNVDAASCAALVNGIDATFTDNCQVMTLTWAKTGATTAVSPLTGINQASATNFNIGTTTLTYIAKDAAGNADTCSFTVRIRDNINPTLTCPANKTENAAIGTCAATVGGIDAIFADNCNVDTLRWTKTGATLANSPAFGINQASNTNFNVGITTVTYIAKDTTGNTSTCSFTVTVIDNQNPTLTCPTNKTQNAAAGLCSATVGGINAIFADNCSVDTLRWTKTGATVATSPTFGINQASNTNFNVGVTTVTYIAKDKAGNSATCNFTVTITDNQSPTLTCPANRIVSPSVGVCSAIVSNLDAVFADNCSVDTLRWTKTGATVATSPTFGINQVSGTSFNLGITNITYIAKDKAGNTTTCTFIVNVIDNLLPTITCPTNVVVCDTVTQNLDAVVADNCQVLSLTWTKTGATIGTSPATGINQATNTSFNAGLTTVTYTVKDAAGNIASCSFTVNLKVKPRAVATVNPLIVCQNDTVRFSTVSAPIGSTYAYTWFQNGVQINTQRSFFLTNLNAGTYDYTVLIKDTSLAGCDSLSQTVTLLVKPKPDATITANGNSTLCFGSSRTLQAATAPAGETWTYQWANNNVPISGATNAQLVVTTSGSYTVAINSSNGCQKTSPVPFLINVVTIPPLTISNLQAEYCENAPRFTPVGFPAGGFFRINGTAFQPPYLPATFGVGTHLLRYTFQTATGCADSVDRTFIVKPAPNVSITTTINPTYCVTDASFALNATPMGGTFAVNNVNIGTNTALNTVSFSPAAVGIRNNVWIKYTYTAPNGCTKVDSLVTNIITKPLVNLGADRQICESVGSITLSALHPTHTGTVNYHWINANTNTVLGSNANLTVTQTGTYIARVTDSRACLPAFDTINIQFNPMPILNLGADRAVCGSQRVVLKANPSGGNLGNFTYLWNTGAITDSLVVLSDTISGTRTYKVKVTNANFPTNCATEDEIVINFLKNPTVNLGADRKVCFPREVPTTLNGFNAANNALNVSYEWYNLFGTTPNTVIGTNASLAVSSQGLYRLKTTTAAGCSASDTVEVLFDNSPAFRIIGTENNVGCQTKDTLYVEATNVLNYEITWSGAGITAVSVNKLQVIVNKSGRYTARIKDKTKPDACEGIATIDVFIGDFPKAEIKPTTPQRFISVCQDSILSLNAAEDNHLPSFVYEWRNLANNQVLATTPTFAVNFANFQTYDPLRIAVRVTPPSGCASGDTVTVQFQRKAVAAILPNFPAQICLGDFFALEATGGDVFDWTSSDKDAKFTATAKVVLKPSKSGVYTYKVTVSQAASKECKPTTAEVTVRVNANPVVKLANKNIRICQDNSQKVNAANNANLASGNAMRYVWRTIRTNEVVGTEAENLFTFDNIKPRPTYEPTQYEVQVTDVRTGCSARDTLTVTFVRKAQPVISRAVRTSFCLGDSVRLTVSGGANYRWHTGQTGESIVAKPKTVGVHVYKVSANFDTTCTAGVDSILLTVNPLPIAKITPEKEINICEGNAATLTASGGIRYEWASGQKTDKIVVSPKATTKYAVRTFNEFGCSSGYDTVLVRVTPKSKIPEKIVLCTGDSTEINATNIDQTATYLWSTQAKTPIIKVKRAGVYTVTVKVQNCEYTMSCEVIFRQKPRIALDTLQYLCFAIDNQREESPYRVYKHTIAGKLLNREFGETYYYEWRYKGSSLPIDAGVVDGDNIARLQISRVDTTYTLYMRTGTGKICDSAANIRIIPTCEARIKVPTAFTPNGDDLNDRFAPLTSDLQGIRVQIFQRWGDIMYEKYINPADNKGWNGIFDEKEGWDGTFGGSPVPVDAYQCVITYWSKNKKGEVVEQKLSSTVAVVREVTR
jgi:gliding motility-associated-like protein